MSNWIYERVVTDKINIDGYTYVRVTTYEYNENRFKVEWKKPFAKSKGNNSFSKITDPEEYKKLEILYQQKKDH